MNLWDIAIEEAKNKELSDIKQNDSTIVVVGSKGTGKSTVILRFLNKDEKPKPTIALEYAYGRQQRSTALAKDVCHIWELGGGILLTKLLETPITLSSLRNLAVVLMIDLSKPEEMLLTLETLLAMLRKHTDKLLEKNSDLKEKLLEASWNRIGIDHVDKEVIDPYPFPLVILGGKYDIFQDIDPENKKIICQTLRYLTLTHGAFLHFFSSKIENLVTKTKSILSYLAFGSQMSRSLSLDYNKPLTIPFGADTLQQIGNISGSEKIVNNSTFTMWKNTFETNFPQVSAKIVMPDDPAKDPNFKEPVIDNLRAQKDEELERYRKEIERRRKILEKSS